MDPNLPKRLNWDSLLTMEKLLRLTFTLIRVGGIRDWEDCSPPSLAEVYFVQAMSSEKAIFLPKMSPPGAK